MVINLNYDRKKERNSHIDFLKERSVLLTDKESNIIREKFISIFVDTTTDYFKEYISNNTAEYKQGKFYFGYLWDTLREYKRVKRNEDLNFLDNLRENKVYVMSDLHSKERLGNAEFLLPFFPINLIIVAKLNDVLPSLAALPQDVYIFDDSFSWYLILTHEWDDSGPQIYYKQSKPYPTM